MSKRTYDSHFFEPERKRRMVPNQGKKHTLDSDEEDNIDEDNVLDNDDIEGEEEGVARQEGEQRMTAFNMTEEMEEGHFDKDGHFIWNNEKEIRDNWLDNIDWQKIKQSSDSAKKYEIDEGGLGDESDSDDENEAPFDELDTYKKILTYMKPKESINKALKRLAGADMNLSSVERLRRKKAGTLKSSEDVTNLTELANQVLTNLGNMDVYQETFEQIQQKIESKEKLYKKNVKEPELDMYADDFDEKEKERLGEQSTSIPTNNDGPSEILWEYKIKANDEEIKGPYKTNQMIKWQKENYFKPNAVVRKCGENSNFYSLSRIDFELYE